MMESFTCAKCEGSMTDSPDGMVLCSHHQGMVHLGCCMYECSNDGKPCVHAKAIYRRE